MKKIFFAFLFLPFFLKSQSIVGGDTTSAGIVYKNIKDSIIVTPQGNGSGEADFDLDSDNVYDIKFKIVRSVSPGHTSVIQQVFSLNNLEFVLLTSPVNYADTIALSNNINASLNWGTSTGGFYLYNMWYSGGNTSIYGSYMKSNTYLGFRKITAVDTVYGWVLVDATFNAHNSIKIMSWAYQSNITDPNGIKEWKKNTIYVYPNPTTNILHISDETNEFENSTLEVTNYLGQTIFKEAYSNDVDVSQLRAGIYTLKINGMGKESLYSKFIKE
ncbi:MAG: T9SS type A sorting domain-containing protein [Bacteroidota bacterium]